MTDPDRITPRTLKGFRDFLPEAMLRREWLIDTAKAVYRSYGFAPIDTPALEYSEILLGKGGAESDKQLYRFEDRGGRDIAMRFDLTVPLARFIAQHVGVVGTPFKRYHAGPVWRAENPQRGRYREFMQCDFDTIGTESTYADVETVLVVHDLFVAFGFERFTVRINNRKVLNGMLETLGIADRSALVLRAIDKLPKIGVDGVVAELEESAGIDREESQRILDFAQISGTNAEVIAALEAAVGTSPIGRTGIAELEAVVSGTSAAGMPQDRLVVDVSIARGLDYYTGTVLETFLDDVPEIGSCCSGGRYDDLASVYTSQRLPGIGASLGVDRLLAAMDELAAGAPRAGAADILVAFFDAEHGEDYVALGSRLRNAGFSVEVYPEAKKLRNQFKYAERRGHRLMIIVGTDEWASGTVQIRDLATGESTEIAREQLVAACRDALAPGA
jgi:histidyl-tRNA synthetase